MSRWQREDGFPSDAYFQAVAAALTEAGVPPCEWDREEDWEVNYKIDPTMVARGPVAGAARHGLYVSWRCDEQAEPSGPDAFTGPGWYWVPYSRPDTALGDYAGELSLAYLAEPPEVAAAVRAVVLGGA
jgi:hypothetical protein